MDKTRSSSPAKPKGLTLGYAGLGKMGFNMVQLLLEKGYGVVAYDLNAGAVESARRLGALAAASPRTLVQALKAPRLVWLMVPHQNVDDILDAILPELVPGDTIVDGGNSFYKDSMRRAARLAEKRVDFLDVGVSGGPGGARRGACLMAGGRKEAYLRWESLFRDLATTEGFGYMGPSGAGHFVKMVHNGIEYGMMQALAEGFAVLKASPFHLDLQAVAHLYNHGSVITSRLVGWLETAFLEHGLDLKGISGSVAQSGEGMWTVETGQELHVPTPVIERSVQFRKDSALSPSYTGRVVSALRNQFGHHDVFEK